MRLLSERLDDDERMKLVASYERLVVAEASGGAEERLQADLGFHANIVRASGNKLLLRQYDGISGLTEWLYRWSEKNWPRRINLLEWHKPIFEAILARDGDAAASAMRIHTQRSLHDDMQDLQNNLSGQHEQ